MEPIAEEEEDLNTIKDPYGKNSKRLLNGEFVLYLENDDVLDDDVSPQYLVEKEG